MIQVEIRETESGKFIANVPIQAAFDYKTTEQKYFDMAWEVAVDDELVDGNTRGKYTFKVLQ